MCFAGSRLVKALAWCFVWPLWPAAVDNVCVPVPPALAIVWQRTFVEASLKNALSLLVGRGWPPYVPAYLPSRVCCDLLAFSLLLVFNNAVNTMSFRCTESSFDKLRQNDDGMPTASSREQDKVEESVRVMYNYFCNKISIDPECPVLRRDDHIVFLKRGLVNLPKGYHCLDSSRPWLCYWILHSLELLDEPLSDQILNGVAEFLGRCQSPTGGFGGGPGQLPHLAPTYAAVNALCIIGTETSYNIIDREKLYQFLKQRKNQDGSFSMHEEGEIDIRGAYCALSIASLTNIATDELFENTVQWIVRCQTYEGGFGGVPGMEAHGGYTFCAFAGLVILGKEHFCDVPVLMRWAAKRQMKYEGGFQGRTNKSVDGCYSFWQGGIFPLIHRFLVKQDAQTVDLEKWLFNQDVPPIQAPFRSIYLYAVSIPAVG